MQGAILS